MAKFVPAKMFNRASNKVREGHRHRLPYASAALELFVYKEHGRWNVVHYPTGYPVGGLTYAKTRKDALHSVTLAIAKHGGARTMQCVAECMAKPDKWPSEPMEVAA